MSEKKLLSNFENLTLDEKVGGNIIQSDCEIANDGNATAATLAAVPAASTEFDRSNQKKQMPNLENEVYHLIVDIGYIGPLLDKNEFNKALQEAPKNLEYANLITFLTSELHALCKTDERVNALTSIDDVNSFIMELSSFLNELGCLHKSLTQGHVSQRLTNIKDKALLIDYLVTELMAARILNVKHPSVPMEVEVKESPQAADLCAIMKTLALSQPPANITTNLLLDKLRARIENATKIAPDVIGKPIFQKSLNEAQWKALAKLQEDIHQEYTMRRQMILTRVDCTIQSFQWSEKAKNKQELFDQMYYNERRLLKAEPNVDLADFLIARTDLAIIEKTSNSSVRRNTKSAINSVLIGEVPDRGGRTSEQAPPPPEMPPWQKRTEGPPGGRGGGNFRGRGRGGNSNYSQQGGNSNYSQQGGNTNYSQQGGNSNFSQREGGSNFTPRDGGANFTPRDGGANFTPRDGGANYTPRDGGSNFSGRDGNNRGSFDSAGSYGGETRRSDNYYEGQQRGSYGNSYTQSYGNNSGHHNRGSFDSAGNYGTPTYQEPKRIKTYDEFQQNRNTYADQYVQDNQQNQQYNPRNGGNRGRGGGRGGRSNYNRNHY